MPNIIPLPQNTFQAPGFVQPKTFDQLPKSIDALFTAYQQGQLERAQLQNATAQAEGAKLTNQTNLINFTQSHMGLSPQEYLTNLPEALGPKPDNNSFYATPVQQPQPAFPGGPAASPMMAQGMQQPNMPWNGNQGQPVPQMNPKAALIRQMLDMGLASQQLGAAQQLAGLQKTQAEAGKVGAEAELTQAQVDMLGGAGNVAKLFADRIQNADMTTDELSNLGRSEVANSLKLGTMHELASRGVNINKLNREAAAKKAGLEAGTKLTEGGSSQELSRAANSAYKQFDLLQKASDEAVRFNNQYANKAFIEISKISSPTTAKLMAALSNARIEWARAASGSRSPSDVFMEEAKKALPDTITPEQLPGVIEQLKGGLGETVQGQLTPATLNDAKSRQNSGGTVRVQLPDGRIGNIPASNLDKAIKKGAKQL